MATIAALLVFTSLSTALPMTAWAEDFYVRITAPASHDGSTRLYVTFDFFVKEGGAEVAYPIRGFAAGVITERPALKAAELESLLGSDGDSSFRAVFRPDENDTINFRINARDVRPDDDSGSPLLADDVDLPFAEPDENRYNVEIPYAASTFDPPTISRVSPDKGPLVGGSLVRLTGTNFVDGSTTVTFNGKRGTWVNVASPGSLSVTTPAGDAAGAVDVVVTTGGGSATASGGFTYDENAPTITAVTPDAGRTGGDTVVTIAGTNFVAGSTTVTFGDNAGTDEDVTSSTLLTVKSPAGVGAVSVVVTVDGVESNRDKIFTYLDIPDLAVPEFLRIDPPSGAVAGGYSATVYGLDLDDVDIVKFGNRKAGDKGEGTLTFYDGGDGGTDRLEIASVPDGQEVGWVSLELTVDGRITHRFPNAFYYAPPNTPPVAADDPDYRTDPNTPLIITTLEDSVLNNDSDADHHTLSAVKRSDPSTGTVTLNRDGRFTYTPNAGFTGTDSFTYVANDGTADSNEAMVTITVQGDNMPPVAVDDPDYRTALNTSLVITDPQDGVLKNDSDAENNALKAVKPTAPAHGSLRLHDDGTFTYMPEADFAGTDSFTYRANDGRDDSNEATVTITVTAGNTPPQAKDDPNYRTIRDTPLVITAPEDGVLSNDTDVEGDALTAEIEVPPSNGSLTLDENGTFTYTPNAGYVGPDHFTYVANDGTHDSEPATVTIEVKTANTPPVAVDDPAAGKTYTTAEETKLTIAADDGVLFNDTDADGDDLTAKLVDDVVNGTLALNEDGSFTYTPNAGYVGPDSFTYKANDGTDDSSEATVTITVNTPPKAMDDREYTTTADTPLVIATAQDGVLANDTDANGDTLTATRPTAPANGHLTLYENGTFTYTPNAGYTGDDSFFYTANDSLDDSEPAEVTISVTARGNTLPVANHDPGYVTILDTPLVIATPENGILNNDTDADYDPLTAIRQTVPSHGTVKLYEDGTFTYTPNNGYVGTDSFTYSANDGTEDSDVATVTITISNTPPVISEIAPNIGLTTGETDTEGNTTTTITGENFVDGQTSVTFGGKPATITAFISDTEIEVEVPPVENGSTVPVIVTVDGLNSNITKTFRYVAVPTVRRVAPASGDEAGGYPVTIYGTHLEDVRQVRFADGLDDVPQGGIEGGTLKFTDGGDGEDALLIKSVQSRYPGSMDIVLVVSAGFFDEITVADGFEYTANAPPNAYDDRLVANIGDRLTGNVLADNGNGVDYDGDGGHIRVVGLSLDGTNWKEISESASTEGGTFTFNDDRGTFTFEPKDAFNGRWEAFYRIEDGQGGLAAARVSIIDNLPPTGEITAPSVVATLDDIEVRVAFDERVYDKDDGSKDWDGKASFLFLNGKLTPGSFKRNGMVGEEDVYTFSVKPDPNLANGEQIWITVKSYSVRDRAGNPNKLKKTVFVTYTMSDAPTLMDDTPDPINEDESLDIKADKGILGNDLPEDALTVTKYQIDSVTYPVDTPLDLGGVGSLIIESDGAYKFTPVEHYDGAVPVITYTASVVGAPAKTATATLTITINPVNDVPQTNDVTASGVINAQVPVKLSGTDVEGRLRHFKITTLPDPAHGILYSDRKRSTPLAMGDTKKATPNNEAAVYFDPATDYKGTAQFQYVAVDKDGAQSSPAATATITIGYPTPVVTGIHPASGPLSGGSSVIITGENFVDEQTSVTFGGKPAPITDFTSANEIEVASPAGDARGAVSVMVTVAGQASKANRTFRYWVVPVFSSINPAGGAKGGGDQVIISGSDFDDVDLVKLGGRFAGKIGDGSLPEDDSLKFVDGGELELDQLIIGSTPKGRGTVGLEFWVFGRRIVVPDVFTYGASVEQAKSFDREMEPAEMMPQSLPTVTAVSPAAGPTDGGRVVTITGTDFVAGHTTVTFVNPTDDTDFDTVPATVAADGQSLTVSSPPRNAGVMDVFVTAPGGDSNRASGAFRYDGTDPEVTISGPASTNDNPFQVTFRFSEAVIGFAAGKVDVTNGGLANLEQDGDDPMVYRADVTADGDGQVTVAITDDTITDEAGRPVVDATATFTFDSTPPTLVITAPSEARGPFTATFNFSEPVDGFAAADVTVGNGTVSDDLADAAGTRTSFTATITPDSHGPVTLDVAAGVATDAAGNQNLAAAQVTVDFIDEAYVRTRTRRVIQNFMSRRAKVITAGEPDLKTRLQGGGGGSAGSARFTGTPDNARLALATSLRQAVNAHDRQKALQRAELADRMAPGAIGDIGQSGVETGFDLWVRGDWSHIAQDTADTDVGLFYI
ncbi:MAG: Ig-like domain-containing protein, partial [Hyphomicrobiaceae bacterium]